MHIYLADGYTIDEVISRMDEYVNDILEEWPLTTTTTTTLSTTIPTGTGTTEETTTTTSTTTTEGPGGVTPGWHIGLLLSSIAVIFLWKRKR